MQYFLISFSFLHHPTLGCSPNGRFTVPVNILSSYLYALPLSLIIALPPVITANINILLLHQLVLVIVYFFLTLFFNVYML